MTKVRSDYRRPQLYRDTNNQWRWHLVTKNGRIGAEGGEGYHNRLECLEALAWATTTNLVKDEMSGDYWLVPKGSLTAAAQDDPDAQRVEIYYD